MTTILFDHEIQTLHDRLALNDVKPLTDSDYTVRGCTALLDAVGYAIKHIESIHRYIEKENVPDNTMFVITTDGMENASRCYKSSDIKEMIENKKEKNGWEFIFIGANIDAVETARTYGISEDRAVNYHADSAGTHVVYEAVSEAVESVRSCAPMTSGWRNKINADFKKRKKNR